MEPVIYREEVLTIMGVLGDIRMELEEIHHLLLGDGGEEEEEEYLTTEHPARPTVATKKGGKA